MKIAVLKQAKNALLKGNMLPVYVILYVTSRCNLRCSHCFFHKSLNKPEEISLEDIEKISKSMPNLLHVSLTGGEPFLREDIEKIAAMFAKNSGAQIISIPTNGMLTEKIAAKTAVIAEENPGTIFNISVSIDGKEEMHNRIRGSKNAFSNACNTLEKLLELKTRYE
jgi:MoaA/NifB/PqqE/SkfB family radical SAM enzyme